MWLLFIHERDQRLAEAFNVLKNGPELWVCILLPPTRLFEHPDIEDLLPSPWPLISHQHHVITGFTFPPIWPFHYKSLTFFQRKPAISGLHCPLLKFPFLFIYRDLIATLERENGCQDVSRCQLGLAGQKPRPATGRLK